MINRLLFNDIDLRLCSRCERVPARPGKAWCKVCAAKPIRRKLCSHCGERPRKKSRQAKLCELCLKSLTEQREWRSELPEAWQLKVDNVASGLLQRAKHHGFATRATRKELAKMLIDQRFRCSLTGAALRADKTTQLGHRVAISRGGDCSIANLFWITTEANRVMGRLTENEFRRLCRSVVGTDPL